METAQSFTARRSATSNLPAFQLPPPDHLSQHKYQPAYALNTSQPTPAIVSSVLTPPPSLQSGLSPLGAASVNSQSSGSSAGGPPYQPMSYWPTPGNNGSYTYSQPPPMPPTFAQGQLNYNNMGRPLYSPSMNYSNRNTNSPASGEGLPLPPDDITLPLFPTSMSSRQAQSLPQFTPQQKMAQQQQQALSQAPPQGPLHAPNNYGELPPPTPTNYYGQGSPPAMAGPIMSNFHSPGNQMALVGGKNMPYSLHRMGAPIYDHYLQQHQQNNRPFKCDQCNRSFNRNHDLKRHKRFHPVVKPFPCGHCEKSFCRKDASKKHMLVKGCGKSNNNATSTIDASSISTDDSDGRLESTSAKKGKDLEFEGNNDNQEDAVLDSKTKKPSVHVPQSEHVEEDPILPALAIIPNGMSTGISAKRGLILERIRQEIHDQVSTSRDTGSRIKSRFQVSCDPRRFMRDQFKDSPMPSIGSVIVLSGTSLNAQATTFKEYLQTHWPKTFQSSLKCLDDILSGLMTCSAATENGLKLFGWMGGEENQILKLEIEGGIEDIVEIGQQMAWLEATMQHSSGPGLRYAEAEFCSVMPGNGVFDITFHQSPLNENEASCWFSLFTSSVMAKDFPIAARGQEVGLEIPIEMMAALTGVRHAVEYEGGILLKGYSSAFVPVKRYKDSIQWHYIENAEEVRLPYWAVEARCPGRAMLDKMNMESVKNTRAFVEWWITTETHLGTETANYENIDWSPAGQVGRAITFSGATLGFQQIMTGEVNFSLGARDGKLHVERKGPYQKIVQCAARSPVVLYDACEKRAWLVPALGVILHIARTRNHRNPFMIDGKEINFPSADPSMSSHEPAEKVLLSQASFKLCAEDYLGNKDYYLGDLVRDIWSYMESLLDKNVTKEATSDPEVRGTMRHLLRGWEFMDLVYDRSPFLLKETYIEKSSGGWTNLARDIDAVVLFGSWFEGIKLNEKFMAGLCHVWKSVPKGKDYLAASVPMMNWLYKVAGSKLSRKHLTSTHLRWHKGGQLWERCDSTKPFSCNCIRLQQVVSDGFAHVGSVSDPGLLEEKGAVIFGQASDPLSSTVLDLLKPKVQQSGNLYSQPNVDLLETDTFSSPDSSLSSDTGMSSISSISVSTLPTSDENDSDLKADGPCTSRGGTVKPNGNDKKRRFSHSLEPSYFEEDVESVQHPNRRSRKQCSKERQDFGVHSEYAHSGPSNKLAERSGLLVEDVVGDGKRLSLRRKRNFIKQVGC